MSRAASGPTVYEVPCACGRTLTVTAGQAGAQIECECGKLVDVPTIRELRRQTAPEGYSQPKAAPRIDPRTANDEFGRTMFALGGIGLILAGLVLFGSLYMFQRSLDQQVDPRLMQWVDKQNENIGKVPADMLWEEWLHDRDRGLGEHRALPEVVNKARAMGAWYGAYTGVGMTGLGVVLLIVAALWPRRAPAK